MHRLQHNNGPGRRVQLCWDDPLRTTHAITTINRIAQTKNTVKDAPAIMTGDTSGAGVEVGAGVKVAVGEGVMVGLGVGLGVNVGVRVGAAVSAGVGVEAAVSQTMLYE